MFFARFKDANGAEHAELYYGHYGWDQYYRNTFNPLTETINFVEFKISGRDYKSRKSSLENIAIEWSYCDSSGLYMSEYIAITEWFYRNGKRYGLLTDFRENAIC